MLIDCLSAIGFSDAPLPREEVLRHLLVDASVCLSDPRSHFRERGLLLLHLPVHLLSLLRRLQTHPDIQTFRAEDTQRAATDDRPQTTDHRPEAQNRLATESIE